MGTPLPLAFTRWVDHKLGGGGRTAFPCQLSKSLPAQSDLQTLARLHSVVSGSRFGDVKDWADLFETCNSNRVYIHGCGAESFSEAMRAEEYWENLAHITWAMITRFEVSKCVDAQQELILRECIGQDMLRCWAKEMAANFGVEILNWTSSFQDGLALCAILTMATGELDMATMQQRDAKHNLEVACAGFARIGVPRLLDLDFVIGCGSKDPFLKKSMVTYVAMVHNKLQEAAF